MVDGEVGESAARDEAPHRGHASRVLLFLRLHRLFPF